VEDIAEVLGFTFGHYRIDVMLLQGWPEATQNCDYCASALSTAAKPLTPQALPIDKTLHIPQQ
jgi:hypothetical protein